MFTVLLAATTSAWTLLGPAGEFANSVAADPINPGVVYAGTGSGLFKGEDAGGSWRLVGSRPACSNVTAVAIDQTAAGTVYAATFTHNCISAGGDGLFRSDDGGETWSTIEVGHPILPLQTAPSVAGRLYVASESCHLDNGFFADCTGQLLRSDDFAASFEPAFAGLPNSDVFFFDIDGSNPLRLWGTAGGVFRSDDAGNSWTKISNLSGIPGTPEIGAIAVDPRDGEILLLSTDEGAFRSTDGGSHWVQSSPSALLVSQFLFDRYLPGVVYGVINNQGVVRSLDDGISWAPFDTGLDGVSIVSQLSEGPGLRDGAILYAATGQGVFAIKVGALPKKIPPPALVHGRE